MSIIQPEPGLAWGIMSEKRRGKQDRRAGRQASRRSQDQGGWGNRELAQVMDHMVSVVLRNSGGVDDALDAECWASELVSIWTRRELTKGEAEEVYLPAFVRALERRASAKALATLRALSAVGSEPHRKRARAAANRLAARRLLEPPWSDHLGRAEPIAAVLTYEDVFEDAVGVFVEFALPAGGRHTLGIYIDHNLGGMVTDTFLAGPLGDLRNDLNLRPPGGAGLEVRRLELSEARALVEDALYMLDHTDDPPVTEDVHILRALIDARIRVLPVRCERPREPSDEERVHLFVVSPDRERRRGHEEASDVIRTRA
jgi:hypothetical protein